MTKFTIRLTLTVEADNLDNAHELDVGAAEHLLDTFNDDSSIDLLVTVEANPAGGQKLSSSVY